MILAEILLLVNLNSNDITLGKCKKGKISWVNIMNQPHGFFHFVLLPLTETIFTDTSRTYLERSVKVASFEDLISVIGAAICQQHDHLVTVSPHTRLRGVLKLKQQINVTNSLTKHHYLQSYRVFCWYLSLFFQVSDQCQPSKKLDIGDFRTNVIEAYKRII